MILNNIFLLQQNVDPTKVGGDMQSPSFYGKNVFYKFKMGKNEV